MHGDEASNGRPESAAAQTKHEGRRCSRRVAEPELSVLLILVRLDPLTFTTRVWSDLDHELVLRLIDIGCRKQAVGQGEHRESDGPAVAAANV